MTDTSITALIASIKENLEDSVHLGNPVNVINPTTGKVIYSLPQLNAAGVTSRVNRIRSAQAQWAAKPVSERAKVLRNLAKLLIEHQEQLLDLLQLETGKARSHALEEMTGAVSSANYYGKISPRILVRKRSRAGIPVATKTFVDQVPLGVVGIITPWNYPLALSMLDVLPALAAGNGVLQKADNQTALITLYARALAVSAGVPEDLYRVVTGPAAEVGNAITDTVDYVAFTGSTATGRLVAERAAKRLIGYSLELGGKNPMIVLPGANLKKAAEIAIGGAFGSAGQLCVSIERLYVHREQFDEFSELLAERVSSLKVGKSKDFNNDVGSLSSAAQLERVSSFVEDAKEQGAKVLAGGTALNELGPNFYAPTVLSDVPENAKMFRSEVFGPVIALTPYQNLAEAIEFANATEYGLNASVVGDEKLALNVAAQIHAGSVNINEGFRASFSSMSSPMGGFKASGFGRRNGHYGLLRFTEAKSIGIAASWFRLPARGSEYQRLAPLLKLMLRILR